MTMWLPDGWWIITEITTNGVRFTAGANGLPEIESSSKFRSDREANGPYNKTGYQLEHREDGFAITVGLMEYISGWSALEILSWLNEKQAIPRRYDNARRH